MTIGHASPGAQPFLYGDAEPIVPRHLLLPESRSIAYCSARGRLSRRAREVSVVERSLRRRRVREVLSPPAARPLQALRRTSTRVG